VYINGEGLPHFRSRAELCVVFDLWFSSARSYRDDAAVCKSKRDHLSWLTARQQLKHQRIIT